MCSPSKKRVREDDTAGSKKRQKQVHHATEVVRPRDSYLDNCLARDILFALQLDENNEKSVFHQRPILSKCCFYEINF